MRRGIWTSWFIAWRYVWAKKSMNIVHLIMWSSILSVVIGVGCLFVVLGFYNGMSENTYDQFSLSCPDLRVSKADGSASFEYDQRKEQYFPSSKVRVAEVLEQEVLMTYRTKKLLVRLVGVDSVFSKILHLSDYTDKKQWKVGTRESPMLIISTRVANQLLIHPDEERDPFLLSAVDVCQGISADVLSQMRSMNAYAFTTYYEIGKDMGGIPVVYTNLDFLRFLINASEHSVSALFLDVNDQEDLAQRKSEWATHYPQFRFQDRYEQNETYFNVFSAEKKMLLLVIFFMLAVAMTGSIGALRILFLEKIKFSKILYTMGQTFASIQRIFFYQSMIINLAGLWGGLCLGGLFLWSQYAFSWLKIQSMTYSIPYAISVSWADVLFVVGGVFSLNLLGIWVAMGGLRKKIRLGMVQRF